MRRSAGSIHHTMATSSTFFIDPTILIIAPPPPPPPLHLPDHLGFPHHIYCGATYMVVCGRCPWRYFSPHSWNCTALSVTRLEAYTWYRPCRGIELAVHAFLEGFTASPAYKRGCYSRTTARNAAASRNLELSSHRKIHR